MTTIHCFCCKKAITASGCPECGAENVAVVEIDELERLRKENAELVKAVKGVVWYLNNAIVSLPHPAALPPQHQVIADLEALILEHHKAEGKA